MASFAVVIMRTIQFVRCRGPLLAAFAAVYVLWGSTYLAIALAVQSIPPFLMIGVRSIAAGAHMKADPRRSRTSAGRSDQPFAAR